MDLPSREQFSPGFKEKISELAIGMTYRKVSETLELLTNLFMSHQTVHRITQEVAENMETLLTALRNSHFKTLYRDRHQEVMFNPEVWITIRKVLKQTRHQPRVW